VRADPGMMRQVLSNLLDNAIKYSARKTNPLIDIDGHVSDTETVYVVRDNGIGFDDQYVGKLFGVLQCLHPTNWFTGTARSR
jgi:two-component system, sensor histidine kinase and response regulator